MSGTAWNLFRRSTIALLLFSTCLTLGCAGKPVPPIFYPGEPDLPRYQYLKSISNATDMKSSALNRMLAEGVFKLKKAYDVAAYKNTLLVTDSQAGGYAVLDFESNKIKLIQQDSNNNQSRILSPFGIAVDEEGNRYIADRQAHRVLMYSNDDRYIKSFDFDPKDSSPVGVEVSGQFLYVTQLRQSRIDRYDINSGELTTSLNYEKTQIKWPSSIAVDVDDLLVTDMLRFEVVRLKQDGSNISAIGGAGDSSGSLTRPKGVAVDKDGRILVVDAAFENFQTFRRDGQLLSFVSQGGGKPENLYLPAGIAISYDLVPYLQKYAAEGFKLEYVVAVANQAGPSKITLFGFGKLEGEDYSKPAK